MLLVPMEAITTSALLSRKYQRRDIIAQGVLSHQSKLCIAGAPKAGKSLLALQMSFELAQGIPFLGIFEVPKPVTSYYLQLEIAEAEFQWRVRRYAEHYGGADFLTLSMRTVRLDTEKGRHFLMEDLKESGAGVLIVDPLARVHTRDENEMRSMSVLTSFFDHLIFTMGISVAIIHHTRKVGFEERMATREASLKMQWMRGTSDIMGWVDGEIIMEKPKEGQARLSFDLRNAKNPEPVLLYQDPDFLYWIPETEYRDKILSWLVEPMKLGDLETNLQQRYQMSRRKARDLIDQLIKQGAIEEKVMAGNVHGRMW